MSIFFLFRRILLFGSLLIGLVSAHVSMAADIIDLGPGVSFESRAYGVSNDGNVVAGYYNGLPYRWSTTGGGQTFRFTGGTGGEARSISADGTVIVGSGDISQGVWRAFRKDGDGSLFNLGVLNNGLQSQAYGVSADGNVVVGYSSTFVDSVGHRDHAFRWSSANGMIDLGVIDGNANSYSRSVSADGYVVVGFSGSSSGQRAFRWTSSGGMVSLGVLTGGSSSSADGVSADGNVVIGTSDSSNGNRAFRWTASGGIQNLGVLPDANSSSARAANFDGSVVVGKVQILGGKEKAFIWDSVSSQMQDLQSVLIAQGATGIGNWSSLSDATAITGNYSGQYNIVGYGTTGGQTHAFLIRGLTYAPEPSTYALATIAAGTIALLARRRNLARA